MKSQLKTFVLIVFAFFFFYSSSVFGYVHEYGNTPQNSINGSWVVVYKNWIYYIDVGGGISKASMDWKYRSRVYKDKYGIEKIYIVNNWIYYSRALSEAGGEPGIFRVSIDGKHREKLIKDNMLAYAMDNWIFYNKDDTLCRSNIDGKGLIRFPFYTDKIAVMGENIYCLNGFSLMVMSMDGKNIKKLEDNVLTFTLNDNMLYLIVGSYGNRTIKSMKLNGENVRIIRSGKEYSDIIVEKNKIFCAGYDDKKEHTPLTQIDINTDEEKMMFPDFCCNFNVINDYLYFFHYDEKIGNTLNRIATDGSNLKMISNYNNY